jgi:aerobic carbon-monoxide dehydrogenase large subunit
MGRFSVGQAVTRTEDQRFLTGAGAFTDDLHVEGEVHGVVLRSPHAHARIRGIDTGGAKAAPGVLAVLTGADAAAAGLGPLPCKVHPDFRDGSKMVRTARPVLAAERVRHVGDPVAFVVATTQEQARDAAEMIEVDYEVLPSATDLRSVLEPGAARVWDEVEGNLALDWDSGDGAAVDRALARAAHVTTIEIVNNRVAPSAMEPRAAIGSFDAQSGRYTLMTGGQGPHSMKEILAKDVLKVDEKQVRVIQKDVGGGFGMKIFVYPEYPMVLWASRVIGRPVRWTAERGESFLSDTHGRDHLTRITIGCDADGRMLAIRASAIANLGAYLSQYGPFIPTDCGAAMYAGVYGFEAVHFEVRCAYTNTVPVDAYRGAGRPEAAYAVERAVDATARDLGIDPAEFRKRNFIPESAFPYTTAMGLTYDSGAFARLLDQALQRADRAGFAARRAESERRGRLRGFGIAYYIEVCGGAPNESAEVRISGEGKVQLLIGNQSNGQGHATAFAQILSDKLGVPFESIETVQGDTDLIRRGSGTGGSRTASVAGVAAIQASDLAIDKGKAIAAEMLEAAPADLRFEDGRYAIVGTDRAIGLFEVAAKAGPAGLDGFATFDPDAATFPNGAHVCEIEIDRDTGQAQILRYTVVDDFGKVVNPLLVAGQVHGGVVQGIGQALCEEAVYDPGSGQLVTGSFMDYALPRADHAPWIDFSTVEIPCRTNPLGVKGCGEAGAIGAPPAVMNALVDALAPLGVAAVDMPATPLRLWRLIQDHAAPQAAE